jgi:hypothetical protein
MAKKYEGIPGIDPALAVAVDEATADAGDGLQEFEVSVKDAPTRTVRAKDSANAWEQYRKVTGMISTVNTPSIRSLTPAMPS